MLKIITYLVINKKDFIPYSKQYSLFYNAVEAVAYAKSIGYDNPLIPVREKMELGMAYVYKCGDIDISILPLEII